MRGYSAEVEGREKVVEVAVIARVGEVMDSAEEQDTSSTPAEDRGGATEGRQGSEQDGGELLDDESGLVEVGCTAPLLLSPLTMV